MSSTITGGRQRWAWLARRRGAERNSFNRQGTRTAIKDQENAFIIMSSPSFSEENTTRLCPVPRTQPARLRGLASWQSGKAAPTRSQSPARAQEPEGLGANWITDAA